jgi:FKBP-type peptidyl-prolyl cis-trans isomerase FklB
MIRNYLIIFTFLSLSIISCKQNEEQAVNLSSDVDSMSYAIGMNIMENLKAQGPDTLNLEAFILGMRNSKADAKLMTDEKANEILDNYFNNARTKEYAQYKTDNEAYLNENKAKEGVVTLPSGLQYKIIKEGTGAKPTIDDVVKTHYKGTLIDGTVFDSSYDRNEPTTFPVGRVIPGWTEALQLMPVGSKWELCIPMELAYGEQGYPPIKPYSTLLFELELLSIEKK